MKRTTYLMAALLLGAMVQPAQTHAEEDLTLLVIPERMPLVQIGFDLIERRPMAMVTYRPQAGESRPLLHAWTGSKWTVLPWATYADGSFLVLTPQRIVLVGDESVLPPALVEASGWGPLVMSVPTTDRDQMLNQLGPILDFRPSEWRWFAARYDMDLVDETPPSRRLSWYEQMSRAREARMQRWQSGEPVAAPIKPITAAMEAPAPVPVQEADPIQDANPVVESIRAPAIAVEPIDTPSEEPEPEPESAPAMAVEPIASAPIETEPEPVVPTEPVVDEVSVDISSDAPVLPEDVELDEPATSDIPMSNALEGEEAGDVLVAE